MSDFEEYGELCSVCDACGCCGYCMGRHGHGCPEWKWYGEAIAGIANLPPCTDCGHSLLGEKVCGVDGCRCS